MPFLIPALPAIIGAAGSIGGALLSKKKKDPFQAQQLQNSQLGHDEAAINLPNARKTLQLPLDYWTKILTGGRDQMLDSMAPEVNTVLGQYDSAFKSLNELSPRGGGRNAAIQNLDFKKMGDVNNLLLGARKEAATNVSDIGSRIGALGTSELNSSTEANSSGMKFDTAQNEQNNAGLASLGKGLGSIIGVLLNKQKSGSSDSSSSPSFVNTGDDGLLMV